MSIHRRMDKQSVVYSYSQIQWNTSQQQKGKSCLYTQQHECIFKTLWWVERSLIQKSIYCIIQLLQSSKIGKTNLPWCNTLASWCEELTHWKRLWCWERLKAGGEGDNRGQDGWMASPIRWTWVWASSGSWWWTGKPGMLQSVGLQRVRHNWVTELNWIESILKNNQNSCYLMGVGNRDS